MSVFCKGTAGQGISLTVDTNYIRGLRCRLERWSGRESLIIGVGEEGKSRRISLALG